MKLVLRENPVSSETRADQEIKVLKATKVRPEKVARLAMKEPRDKKDLLVTKERSEAQVTKVNKAWMDLRVNP